MEAMLHASTSGSEIQEEKSDGSIGHEEGKRVALSLSLHWPCYAFDINALQKKDDFFF